VPDGEYLLDNNNFEFIQDSTFVDANIISVEDLASVIKQKPNRKVMLKTRLHLRLYNLSNQERIIEDRKKNQIKVDRKNEKIRIKNTKKIEINPQYAVKKELERKLTFGEKLRNAGEPPVILDSLALEKSRKQLSIYLINKGYFNNSVKYSIIYNEKKQKRAEVIYLINRTKPFVYKNIKYSISDYLLKKTIDSIPKQSMLKIGNNFDTDILNQERERITSYLFNHGYHLFNKEFIYFQVDTSIGNNNINLNLGIQNYKHKDEFSDSIIQKEHCRYKIDRILFRITDDLSNNNLDSIMNYRTIRLSFNDKLICNPQLLYHALQIKRSELYSKEKAEITYKKLSSLGLFETVVINFDTVSTKINVNGLAVNIGLKPAKSQTFVMSVDGKNTDGLFGIEGSVSYSHRNIFKRAEKLSISMTGGIETQLLVTSSDNNDITQNLFNTLEFGPRVSLLIPRYAFIKDLLPVRHHYNAKTNLSMALNYQKRPDFTRTIQEMSFAWIIHEKPSITWHITPILINAIYIDKEQSLEDEIAALNDKFIAASFQNHVITGGLYSFEYNGQNDKKVKNVFYLKTTFETAGGVLYNTHKVINKPIDNIASNSYNLFGVRYAHFQKIALDLRYYIPLSKRSKLVYRFAGGIGVPRENLKEALPFEKSFFSGGANGLRAWRARSLGPGSYLDKDFSYDKIGDIKLEGNFEARFPLTSWIDGAFFVDAGNVWLINSDSLRPGGDFDKDRFLSEIAFGSGLGIRMDLDFFIIRFDFGIPIKNPSLPLNNRWIFGNFIGNEDFYKLQFNLGIGYPF